MSQEEFQSWVKNTGVNFDSLNSIEKVKYRKEFDSKHRAEKNVDKFTFLHSDLLSSWGLIDKDDQYIFYGMFATGIGMYFNLTYKHRQLRAYIKELEPDQTTIKDGKVEFTPDPKLSKARKYLNANSYKPRLWLILCPLTFYGYECLKRGPNPFQWNKKSV